MQNSGVICRLCLETILNDSYYTLEHIRRDMLEFLIPEINLEISLKPNICSKCHESLLKCYELKSSCIEKIYLTKPEAAPDEDIDDIFEEQYHGQGQLQQNMKCCICMESVSEFNVKVEEAMLEKYLPELTSNRTEVACKTCAEALQHHFHFITSCLKTEEDIRKHRMQATNSQQFVNLHEVKQNALRHPENCVIKLETGSEEFNALLGINTETEFIFEDKRVEEEYQKSSESLHGEKSAENYKHIDSERMLEIFITSHKSFEGNLEYRCEYCSFQSHRKPFLDHLNKHKKEQDVVIKCALCHYEAKNMYAFLCSHLLIHDVPAQMLKCSVCPYEATLARYLVRHMSINHALKSPTFKCDRCSFNTKHRTALLNHLLIHKDPSQVPTYHCDNCTYVTKHKRYLHRHVLIHKSKSEVRTYSCDVCTYKAKRKDVMKVHMLNHRKASKSKTYNCQDCGYETGNKNKLKAHEQSHSVKTEESLMRKNS